MKYPVQGTDAQDHRTEERRGQIKAREGVDGVHAHNRARARQMGQARAAQSLAPPTPSPSPVAQGHLVRAGVATAHGRKTLI